MRRGKSASASSASGAGFKRTQTRGWRADGSAARSGQAHAARQAVGSLTGRGRRSTGSTEEPRPNQSGRRCSLCTGNKYHLRLERRDRRGQLHHPNRRLERVPNAFHRGSDGHRFAFQHQHATEENDVVARPGEQQLRERRLLVVRAAVRSEELKQDAHCRCSPGCGTRAGVPRSGSSAVEDVLVSPKFVTLVPCSAETAPSAVEQR